MRTIFKQENDFLLTQQRYKPMNTVSHNANQEDNRKEMRQQPSASFHDKAEKRNQTNTPQNNRVDVFEFEPNGFMSNGRW